MADLARGPWASPRRPPGLQTTQALPRLAAPGPAARGRSTSGQAGSADRRRRWRRAAEQLPQSPPPRAASSAPFQNWTQPASRLRSAAWPPAPLTWDCAGGPSSSGVPNGVPDGVVFLLPPPTVCRQCPHRSARELDLTATCSLPIPAAPDGAALCPRLTADAWETQKERRALPAEARLRSPLPALALCTSLNSGLPPSVRA